MSKLSKKLRTTASKFVTSPSITDLLFIAAFEIEKQAKEFKTKAAEIVQLRTLWETNEMSSYDMNCRHCKEHMAIREQALKGNQDAT